MIPATDDRYLRLAELAAYSSLSVRTLQRAIAAKKNPLPAHRVGKAVLVRRSDFDGWLAASRARADEETRRWVRSLVRG